MKLVIYRAADAFLYLPTYVAEELGIFKTLLRGLGVTEVEFKTSKGDADAVIDMHKANSETDTISIAIGDPTAFLSLRVREENGFKKDDIRVIGAIINKLSFWAVNHTNTVFNSIEDFEKEFTKVIHYNDELITGYYLGNKVKNLSKINNGRTVDFGTEIDVLEEEEDFKKLAITADIVSVAKGISRTTNALTINYRFSKPNEDHLTTGITTTVKCCQEHTEILNKIIEGIQKSILIIYSSNQVAEKICETISKKPAFNKVTIDQATISKIIDLINEDKFYPADLNISEKGWKESLTALAKTHQWNSEIEKEVLETSFQKYVDNSFVHRAEKSLANQLGINLETFEEEIKPLKEENKQLKERAKYYIPWLSVCNNALYYLLRSIKKHFKFIVLAIVGISLFAIYKLYIKEPITAKEWFLAGAGGILASIVGAFLYDWFKKKNEQSS